MGFSQKVRKENQNQDGKFGWKRQKKKEKKSTKTGLNDKTNNNTTLGNKPESTGERRRIKEISTKSKTIKAK